MRAMVVDDSRVQARVVAMQLRGMDWLVIEATDARAAAAAFRWAPVDLVVTDLQLGQPSGLVLARWLRRQGAAVRIIGLTAGALPTATVRARAGFSQVLAKPLRSDALRVFGDAPELPLPTDRLIDGDRIERLFVELGDRVARHLLMRFLSEGKAQAESSVAADRHKLAGAAAVFGAEALAAALQPAVHVSSKALLSIWVDTSFAIERWLRQNRDACPPQATP